jgi:outer membrane protein assembly factor BamB
MSTKRETRKRLCLVIASCWLLNGFTTHQVIAAEPWTQWRGPERNGIASGPSPPLTWSATENVRWKTALPGSGISSPIFWENRIFVTAAEREHPDQLHLICLSRDDGSILWQRRFWGTAPTRFHATKSSMASPTPITDGRFVYAYYGTGDVFCVDLEGRLQWQRSLAGEYGRFENRFSATSSPVLLNNLLILQCDHYGPSYAIALDKGSGKNVWKTARPKTWLSWSSPRLVPTPNGQELILCSSLKIDGLNPRTGQLLWTIDGMRRECIPTPVFGHGLIYAVSGPKGPTLAIRPGGRGNVTESHVKWENQRGAPYVPSAILVGDYYYLVDDQGISTCLDAHTGTRVWQKRLTGAFTASPIATDQSIYFTNEDGLTIVLAAHQDRYVERARNRIEESVYASSVIDNGQLLIRSSRHLWCISD